MSRRLRARSRSLATSLLTSAVASCLTLTAQAQSAPTDQQKQAVTLDQIQVSAQRLPLQSPASGGTRLDASLLQTPASVMVIDRQLLDARSVRTTQEALYAVPGLVVASPPGHGNTISYRGFSGSQISQLFNGIDVQYAAIAARPVDAWMYERVEAIGGPSTFLYGAGAMGGSINYVTRLARLDRDSLDGMASVASDDTVVVAAGINKRLGGGQRGGQQGDARNALRADISYSSSDGWADNNDRESLTTALSLASALSDNLTHTLAVEYQHEDSARPYWGTPALLSDSGKLQVLPGTETDNYNVGDGYYKQDVTWLRSLLEWRASERSTVRNTAYYYDALRDYRNVESYRFNSELSAVIRSDALLQRHDQQLFGNKLEWSYQGQIAGRSSQSNLGLDLSYNRQTRFPLSLPDDFDEVPIGAVTPGSFFDVPGAAQVFNPQRTNRVHTQALFAENLTELGQQWSLMSALRHDWISLNLENHQTASARNPARYQHDYSTATGRIAINRMLAPGWAMYLQYATAADPPAGVLSTASFSSVQDFDLTRGRQFELGSKWQSADGRAWLTLALYDISRENLAISDPDNPGQTLPVGKQSSWGAEAAFAWQPLSQLSLQGNLAWVDASLDEFYSGNVSYAGNQPANTPDTVANLWLDYQWQPRWSAGLDLRSVASRYADNANTLTSAGYTVWGANLRFTPQPGTELALRLRNLGDKTYVAYALNANMVYLGEPRTLELSWRQSF
ncbi:TonB-dependent receptor [Pseudoxanthomonas dokdonensis]|uniref:TonB-dependent receptor n=1 Tax=Pseudoxanthomonas dokdonensis TaxID=344882 RepID=UPI000B0331B4|nr:TonB-dependent siderophore receptor [Pseudoxanthomonas dokdonensis]